MGIINTLFRAAGCPIEFSESAAKQWINGVRNCQTKRYFPNGKLNDEEAVFKQFRNRPEQNLKKLQQIFREEKDADSPIDVSTEDMDVFCWSVVNQFLDILKLPRRTTSFDNNSYILERDAPVDICKTESQNEIPKERQVRELFLDAVREYEIMEIINRRPAILTRYDSANFNVFYRQMSTQIASYDLNQSSPLQAMINTFLNQIIIQAVTLDGNLNIRFGPDDNDASFNMEMNGVERKKDQKRYGRRMKRLKIPEVSTELVESSADPLGMLRAITSEWVNFRNEMNRLFEAICSLADEKTDT